MNLWQRYGAISREPLDQKIDEMQVTPLQKRFFPLFRHQKEPIIEEKKMMEVLQNSEEFSILETKHSMKDIVNGLRSFLPKSKDVLSSPKSNVYLSLEKTEESKEKINAEIEEKRRRLTKEEDSFLEKEEILLETFEEFSEALSDEINEISKCSDKEIKVNKEISEEESQLNHLMEKKLEEIDSNQKNLIFMENQEKTTYLEEPMKNKAIDLSKENELNRLSEYSFEEEEFEHVSFSEDMLDESFTDDILDEEMEEVLSVLDRYTQENSEKVQISEIELNMSEKISNENQKKKLTYDVKNKTSFRENNDKTISSELINSSDYEKGYSFLSNKVCDVKEEPWIDSYGHKGLQKVILDQEGRIIQLRQNWFFTPVEVGDNLYLHGEYDENGICAVDNSHFFIILNPDFLVSCTSVATSYSCTRKTILQERIKMTSDVSVSQIYGKILHCLFQLCLENNNFTLSFLKEKTEYLILNNLEFLNEMGESIERAMIHISKKFPNLQEWASRYFIDTPKEDSYVITHKKRTSETHLISINKLLKIEEHILSPKYGLKGNIDATVQVAVKSDTNLQYLIAPFELKTGNNIHIMQHRAQTILYTLLLSQHYGRSLIYIAYH